FILFVITSRRRHTRSKRDWSSDVCSSDMSVAINQHNPDPLALQVRIPLFWIGYFYLAFFYLHVSQSKERMQMSLNNPCSHIHNRLHTYQSSYDQFHQLNLPNHDTICRQ